MNHYLIQKEQDLLQLVQYIKLQYPDFHIFLLKGELGTGKTTFVKYFVQSFSPNYEVQSPTFSLANVYTLSQIKILHADLYRLKSEEELLEAGIPELLMNCNYAFVEWFELLLPWIEKALIIEIKIEKNNRIFYFRTFP